MLPPKNLRKCHANFKDDNYYVKSALQDLQRVEQYFNFAEISTVLDIGCGTGRLGTAIFDKHPNIKYIGIDVDANCIAWCKANLPGEFYHIDWYNARYNKSGQKIPKMPDIKADIGFGFSILTHLEPSDVVLYAKWLFNVVANGCLFTAYIEENVPDWEENPHDYPPNCPVKSHGRLHRVRYNRDYLFDIFNQNGWKIKYWKHCTNWLVQSEFVVEIEDKS